MRCRGNNSSLQLGAKNPILLPHDHHYVKLLINDVHKKIHHGGINDILTMIREEHWILQGRQAVKGVIQHCITCKKMDGFAYPTVNPPDLPSARVSDVLPFSNTEVAFAELLYVNQTMGCRFESSLKDLDVSKEFIAVISNWLQHRLLEEFSN